MAFDRRETLFLLIGDFFVLVGSLWVALSLRNLALPSFGYFQTNFVPFLPMFCLSLAIFYIAGLYEKQTRPIRRIMGTRILGAQAATTTISAFLFFILPLSIAPKTILLLYLIVSVIVESVWRFYRMNYEIAYGKRIPVILVGSGPVADELYDEVNGNNKYMIRFINRVEKNESLSDEMAGIVTMKVEPLYEEIFDRVPLEAELLNGSLRHHPFYDSAKRLFDIIFATIGLLIATPFILLATFLLFLENGAPFLYHERIGKNGRTFRIMKLRSMLFDDHGNPELHAKNRVTLLGKILRKTRIDELPQLWNILIGDLSFIGPRPELPKIAEVYEKEIPQFHLRHLITPGLSGWAQIHDSDPPKGGADVERTKRKLSFDLYYLKHRSFGLDLAIAVKTIRTLLSFSGT